MKIVFIGQEQAGYDVLEMLLRCREDIPLVVTRKISDDIADYVSFKALEDMMARGHVNHIIQIDNIEFATEEIKDAKPDLIIVVSWSEIIPKEILDIAPTIGIHYSLLPERRGGAPIAWALIDGLEKSGITLFYYTEKIDAGGIIAQKKFNIRDDDKPSDLLKVINKLCVEIIKENLPNLKDGTAWAGRSLQDESKATYTKKRGPKDSEIFPECDATPACKLPELILEPLYDYIRALDDPYPHAFILYHGKKISFSKAKMKDGKIICQAVIADVE